MAQGEEEEGGWVAVFPIPAVFFPLFLQEFTELQRTQNEELARSCDSFFELLDNFAETKNKHRSVIWPLQLMLLILTPKVSNLNSM